MVPVIGWLRSALRRLSPRARAIALVVLLLAAAVLALAPTHKAGRRTQRPSTRATTSRTTRSARHVRVTGFGGANRACSPGGAYVPRRLPAVRVRPGVRGFGAGGHACASPAAEARPRPGHASGATPPSAGRVADRAGPGVGGRCCHGAGRRRRDRELRGAAHAPANEPGWLVSRVGGG